MVLQSFKAPLAALSVSWCQLLYCIILRTRPAMCLSCHTLTGAESLGHSAMQGWRQCALCSLAAWILRHSCSNAASSPIPSVPPPSSASWPPFSVCLLCLGIAYIDAIDFTDGCGSVFVFSGAAGAASVTSPSASVPDQTRNMSAISKACSTLGVPSAHLLDPVSPWQRLSEPWAQQNSTFTTPALARTIGC